MDSWLISAWALTCQYLGEVTCAIWLLKLYTCPIRAIFPYWCSTPEEGHIWVKLHHIVPYCACLDKTPEESQILPFCPLLHMPRYVLRRWSNSAILSSYQENFVHKLKMSPVVRKFLPSHHQHPYICLILTWPLPDILWGPILPFSDLPVYLL